MVGFINRKKKSEESIQEARIRMSFQSHIQGGDKEAEQQNQSSLVNTRSHGVK